MADTCDSSSQASPDSIRRQNSWGRTPVVVYDATEGKLFRVPENDAAGYLRAIMPGKRMKADIYLELENSGDLQGKALAWLAKVDLTKLGMTARWKRRRGEIKYVYVKKGAQNPGDLQIK